AASRGIRGGRPCETTPRTPGAAGVPQGGAAQQEGGEAGTEQPDVGFLGTLGQLIRVALPNQRGPGGGGGGGLGGLGFIAQAFGRTGGGGGGGGGGGFGGFGGGAPAVPSGDYLVSITVDGKTLSRVLRVERASGTGLGASFAFD